jgi:hypothetical protein
MFVQRGGRETSKAAVVFLSSVKGLADGLIN